MLPSWVSALSLDRVQIGALSWGIQTPYKRLSPRKAIQDTAPNLLLWSWELPPPLASTLLKPPMTQAAWTIPIKQPGHQYPGKEVGRCFSVLHGKVSERYISPYSLVASGRQKVAMGKGRNLSPSAVTGGREHIRDTGEHKTLATLISFVPRAPSGAGSHRKAGSASTLSNSLMSLLKINCLVIS